MVFILFISFLMLTRIVELIYSKRNEHWLLQNGAVEYGNKHYPFMILLHVSFLSSLIIEYYILQPSPYSISLIMLYFLLILLKIWTISLLGKFWCTKVYRILHVSVIKKGIYKYLKHPNYMIVIAEIAIIPLIFHLYYTACIFSMLNAIMLYVRIKVENKALDEG